MVVVSPGGCLGALTAITKRKLPSGSWEPPAFGRIQQSYPVVHSLISSAPSSKKIKTKLQGSVLGVSSIWPSLRDKWVDCGGTMPRQGLTLLGEGDVLPSLRISCPLVLCPYIPCRHILDTCVSHVHTSQVYMQLTHMLSTSPRFHSFCVLCPEYMHPCVASWAHDLWAPSWVHICRLSSA